MCEGTISTRKGENRGSIAIEGRKFPAWMLQLPDRLKSNDRLSRFNSIGELAEAYLRITLR